MLVPTLSGLGLKQREIATFIISTSAQRGVAADARKT